MPDPVQTVIPVAGADEWQTVRTHGQAALDGSHAVLVKGPAFACRLGSTVGLHLA